MATEKRYIQFMKVLEFKGSKPKAPEKECMDKNEYTGEMSLAIQKVEHDIIIIVNGHIHLCIPEEAARQLGADLITMSDPRFQT